MHEVHFIGNRQFWDWFIEEAEKARDGGVGFLTADPGSSYNTGSMFVSFRSGHHKTLPNDRRLFGASIGDPSEIPVGNPFFDFEADDETLYVPTDLEGASG